MRTERAADNLIARTTPVANEILDRHMRSLKDTELRVLLVVMRQTIGWRAEETGNRKQREWISHAWFKRVTGRSSSSVSNAVDHLVKVGLLLATDGTGRPILSKHERRIHKGKLYFSIPENESCKVRQSTLKSEDRKLEIIKLKDIKHKNKEGCKLREQGRHSGWIRANDVALLEARAELPTRSTPLPRLNGGEDEK